MEIFGTFPTQLKLKVKAADAVIRVNVGEMCIMLNVYQMMENVVKKCRLRQVTISEDPLLPTHASYQFWEMDYVQLAIFW